MSIITMEGGLTILGYALCITVLILLLILILINSSRNSTTLSAKQLVFSSLAISLAFLTSYVKIIPLPFGGSVTLFSMLFICLIGNWYGIKIGIITGFAYGILQFLQEPFVLSPFQVCCDYILAFASLGLSGLFSKSKHGLTKGYLLGVMMRGVFHSIGGYLYWMDYMPDNFPIFLNAAYPIIYNYSYLLTEVLLTLVLIAMPPVANALARIKQNAN